MGQSVKQILQDAGACIDNKNYSQAFELYDLILNELPSNPLALFDKAKLYSKLEKYHQALELFEKVLGLTDSKHVIYVNMGDCSVAIGKISDAIEYYKKSIKYKPDYVNPYIPCVNMMEREGQVTQATELVDRALQIFPNHPQILFTKAKLAVVNKNFQQADEDFKIVCNADLPIDMKHIMLGDYAFLKEKMRQYDKAFGLSVQAQKMASQTDKSKNVDAKFRNDTIISSQKWFSDSDVKGWCDLKFNVNRRLQAPVFLVGFPRSGTTLLEQILHSHSNLTVTDEAQILFAKLQYLDKIIGRKIQYPQGLNQLSVDDINNWRAEYFAAMKRVFPDKNHDLRIVDKNPMSILYVGFINRFFPDAHILTMIRDPRDVVLSCFFQTFVPNPETINFFSLEDSAKFYAKTMNLWLKYKQNLPMKMLEIRYEDLIRDVEGKSKEVIEFIGEKWDDNVLNYYHEHNRRTIRTPSYKAVNQPVYNKSIGKWQNYQEHFQPIMPILEPFIDQFSYS